MTALELSQNIGKIGIFPVYPMDGTLQYKVKILDAKKAYGCPRYLITPVSGTGSQWVNADRVSILNEEEKKS